MHAYFKLLLHFLFVVLFPFRLLVRACLPSFPCNFSIVVDVDNDDVAVAAAVVVYYYRFSHRCILNDDTMYFRCVLDRYYYILLRYGIFMHGMAVIFVAVVA